MRALLPCEVSDGFRPQEATVKVVGVNGVAEYLPVDRSLLHKDGKKTYVRVSLRGFLNGREEALVILPQEADSGAKQVWVKSAALKPLPEGAGNDPF